MLVALLIGLLASFAFHRYIAKRESKELINRAKSLLLKEAEENLQLIKKHKEKIGTHSLYPNPFFTSSFQVVLQGRLIDNLEPEVSKKILDLYDIIIGLNSTYSKIEERGFGITSALSGSPEVLKHLWQNFTIQLDHAERLILAVLPSFKNDKNESALT